MDNILKDIDRLEAKLNIVEFNNDSINVEDLDSKQFDLKLFFRKNFLENKDNKKLNYEKIQNTITHI